MENTNSNPASPRMAFQWKYFAECDATEPPEVLNIGCADDPLSFGEAAFHYDLDDWSYKHKWFKQGDANSLPFPDGTFQLVIMGDILEHLEDPHKAVSEAIRVLRVGGRLVITVFEEWRLPGPGQWLKEGHELATKTVQEMGYQDLEDHQKVLYPDRVGFPEAEVSHLIHINQFTDVDMQNMAGWIASQGCAPLELIKAYEATHEGHRWYNWLFAMEKVK